MSKIKNRILSSIVLLFVFVLGAQAQTEQSISEDQPFKENGMEYGYRIRNEETKNIKDDSYSRYEIQLYATNNSGCSKVLLHRDLRSGFTLDLLASKEAIAYFYCQNATGKRLTSKTGEITARPFNIEYSFQEKAPNGTMQTKYANGPAGVAIRNGETIINNIIVIVPLGEKPIFIVKALNRFSVL